MPDRDTLITRVTTSMAAGDPPDLFLINYRFYGQFADRGVLEPLQERLDGSDVLAEDAMYGLALDAFRDDKGDLICLPQNVSSLVVYYNRDLFEAAGVPLPKAGWTWDDMTAAAAAMRDGDQYGLGVEASIIRLAPFVWSNGGDIVDDPAEPTRLDPGHARIAGRSREVPRPPRRRAHPLRRGVRRRGRRGPLRQRAARHVPELPPGHAAVPAHRGLRVGRRPVARAR